MIEIIDLHKQYKSKKGPDHQALNGINLELGSKGFVVLLGKSGSGKSTLLNIIGGLDKFDSGEIIIKGKSTKDFKNNEWDSYRNTYVGFIFQEFYIIEEFTVGKNIALALELQGYDKEEIPKRVEEILASVELDGYKERKPNEISGGQKQRIAIARALVKDPKILLADEPTGNLDSETGKAILETLKELSKEKLVIMVTHDVDFAYQYGDRIIELKDGLVISDTIDDNKTEKNQIVDIDGPVKSIIKLSSRKQLTNEMIDHINNILIKSKEDVYLRLNKNKDYIKTLAPTIDEETKSKKKSYEFLNYDEYDRDFELKKSSLNFKDAFKMAISSIFTKKLRLFFMMLLFVASLVFVGIATNFSSYDTAKTAALTFDDVGLENIIFDKKVKGECDDSGCRYDSESVSKEEIESLRKQYKGFTISRAIDLGRDIKISSVYDNGEDITSNIDNDYYLYADHIGYIIVFEEIDDINYKIIEGTNIVDNNDILITDFIADILKYFQVYGEINDDNELIGKPVIIKNLEFKIAGIVDTDYEKYDYLKQEQDNRAEFDRSGFDVEVMYQYTKIITTENNMENSIKGNWFHGVIENENFSNFFMKKSKFDDKNNLIGKLPSSNNDIVLPLSEIYMLINKGKSFEDTIYPEDIINNKDGVLDNILNSKINLNINKEIEEYTIVGIYNNYSSDTISFPKMYIAIITDDRFTELYKPDEYNYIQIALKDNYRDNVKVLSDLEDNNFEHMTKYSYKIDVLKMTTENENNRKILYGITFVFAVFATIMIFTFISSSVTAKKKEIGTLRAIGARGIDVSKIFITEAMIITLSASIIASILTDVIIKLLNNDATKNFNLDIVLLYTNFISYVAIFGLGIIVTMLASFIPIKRITVMKPIDAIKNK